MHVIRSRGWEIPERLATPEHLFFNRRVFLAGGASAMALMPNAASAQRVSDATGPNATRNVLDRTITDEKINAYYNNFYEFSSSKELAEREGCRPGRGR